MWCGGMNFTTLKSASCRKRSNVVTGCHGRGSHWDLKGSVCATVLRPTFICISAATRTSPEPLSMRAKSSSNKSEFHDAFGLFGAGDHHLFLQPLVIEILPVQHGNGVMAGNPVLHHQGCNRSL